MANRLSEESSPYLLQHQDNPVDWYPWGPEALERAREEDRPILLSIGYSSCHWCHVMERESFEDPETAELMNESFVNVKVDREERPDLDSVYMTAVQSMTGRGGWPLTVFLTPDGVPYYGGTYFPPEPRHGMPSFPQVLRAARDAYRNRREDVEEAAGKLVDALERSTRIRADGSGAYGPEGKAPDEDLLRRAARTASTRFDDAHGGFGDAPKFPRAPALDFLLRWHHRSGADEALRMVGTTLDRMARGGIRDHLAGGFHRYAVDRRWLVPHFEKMLYDNALLARLYLHHHLATGEAASREVAVDTLDYLLEDLQSPEGGFYSARDADSEGEEGRYYVWSAAEVDEVLGAEEGAFFRRVYGVTEAGNWEGTNVLHLPRSLPDVARSEGMDPGDLEERLQADRRRLLERRSRREEPLRDEKVLAGWNGLVVRALAEAGAALDRPRYVEAARRAASFLLDEMRSGDRLLHSWKDGDTGVAGFLEDHASLGLALLALHEATLEPRWLEEALWCAEATLEHFWSEEDGAFYDTADDAEELVIRPRDATDDPSPSGSSLAVELLFRGAVILDRDRWREAARRSLAREAGALERHPLAFGALLGSLDFHLSSPVEVAVTGPRDAEETRKLAAVVHRRYLPNRVVVGRGPEDGPAPDIPLLEGREPGDRPTAYVCRNYACREPVTEAGELEEQLAGEASAAG